jgi:hypothetical protein
MPTRRAFLVAGATFTFGAALGGACGYSIGAASVPAAAQPDPVDAPLEPSGDADLDELRRLAVKAPIEELIEKRLWFLRSIGAVYRRDDILWEGLVRLSQAVESDVAFPDRFIAARLIAQDVEYADPDYRSKFEEIGKAMRRLR